MKKLSILLVGFCISLIGLSQSCLPEGIIFNTQYQIDSFQVNYPGCTEIEGDVIINGDSVITNLNGLSILTSIGGDLTIYNNFVLINLMGLEGLISIGGYLNIGIFNVNSGVYEGNPNLTSLTGLNNLFSIGKSLAIVNNDALTNLEGLENLTIIDWGLNVSDNDALINLRGLEGLTSLIGLYIVGNEVFNNFTGLDNLTHIENDLQIGKDDMYWGGEGNPSLENLFGLNNLTTVGGNLSLYYNNSLSNLTGLENLTSIGGDLMIYSNIGLTSLSALASLTSIQGSLIIRLNTNLTNLTGLDNLKSIGQSFYIANNFSLTSLNGLNQIKFIGGGLNIDDNNVLASLTGFEDLDSIGEYIWIAYNDNLTSLTGIDNLQGESILDLFIYNNSSLSICDVQSICDYLASPNGTVEIHDNAEGCNSQEEVVAACSFGLNESASFENQFYIFPNPSSTQITIETLVIPTKIQLSIYNFNGQQLIRRQISESRTVIGIRNLPDGFYFVRLEGEKMVGVEKFIKIE